ncbi:RTA1 like protein-domain-containing protein [Amylocarpus encephaloides]|uniref:RTA1 like protein-domain-containing protein n=1 Tax=Amylocarpus encephaloides TaxID=45428 RepID=A0A9P7Y6W0_9HELO|nr:RTA1 like protein-domain-containing protein [Amylocarpus encephaloides]
MSSTTVILSRTATATSSATPSCISVTPDKNGYVPEYACDSNYPYYPSFGAAIFFAVAFGISLTIHLTQAFVHKKWKVCWVMIMGVAWEFTSFAIRSYGTKHQQNTPIATVSNILFLLAPMWINAFVYMVLGRMIYFFIPEQQLWGIKGIKIAKIFVWLDVASFLTQVGGGVLITPGQDAKVLQIGINIYMGGVGFQQACILVFTAIAVKFVFSMKHLERTGIVGGQILDGRPSNWRALLYTLFGTLVFISIRIIFRLVEFAGGNEPDKNPIPFHEGYIYGLDATPILLCAILLNFIHPGRILRGENSEFPKAPTRKEKKQLKRENKEAKRAIKMGKVNSIENV